MQHDEAADLLQQNLEEEKATDQKLSALAEGGINQSAAELAHPEVGRGRRPHAEPRCTHAEVA